MLTYDLTKQTGHFTNACMSASKTIYHRGTKLRGENAIKAYPRQESGS